LSLADLEKWDARYREGQYASRRHPTALLERLIDDLRRGAALDVACGAGRNALYLAGQGFAVDAVDISAAGLERLGADADADGLAVRALEADLENGIPAGLPLADRYELIVMVRYVNLPLVAALIEKLADGGIFLSEQHLTTDRDVVGPRNEAYRLAPNALLEAARGLRIHFYREGLVTDPDGRRAALAQVVASRGGVGLLVA
jgi:SAM-dependent methyltransferase